MAHRLRGFDVNLVGADLPDVKWDGIVRAELDELLRTANMVTLHVPLLPSTRGLIGARELALMHPGAILDQHVPRRRRRRGGAGRCAAGEAAGRRRARRVRRASRRTGRRCSRCRTWCSRLTSRESASTASRRCSRWPRASMLDVVAGGASPGAAQPGRARRRGCSAGMTGQVDTPLRVGVVGAGIGVNYAEASGASPGPKSSRCAPPRRAPSCPPPRGSASTGVYTD